MLSSFQVSAAWCSATGSRRMLAGLLPSVTSAMARRMALENTGSTMRSPFLFCRVP